jgi:hypothetical protein
LKLEFSRKLFERTEADEEEPVYGRADHWDIEAERGWYDDGGSVP